MTTVRNDKEIYKYKFSKGYSKGSTGLSLNFENYYVHEGFTVVLIFSP